MLMGKLGLRELKSVVRCIKRGSSILVPPGVGLDSGVHKIPGGLCLVVSTDPCVGVPKSWFGWLLVHYAASDVAVFGVAPRFCAVTLRGPPRTPTRLFQSVMRDACHAANQLGMQIVTGHTGSYDGLDDMVGTCAAYGFASLREVKTPRGVRAGDNIVCTKPLGLETAVTFSQTQRALAQRLFGKSRANRLSRQFQFQSCVKEALALSKMPGVHAMHDAAEGGLVSALNEMAEASKTGFSIDFTKVAVPREVYILARHFRLSTNEMMSMSSTGTLIAALEPSAEGRVLRRLSELKTLARVVGTFSRSRRRRANDHLGERPFPDRAQDPFSRICL